MQRIVSMMRTFTSLSNNFQLPTFQNSVSSVFQHRDCMKLLVPFNPMVNATCGFKVKGRVRRRCKSCYIVFRDERVYNICPKFPRHKQMSMKPKPLTTYILTHATQGRVRPW